MTADELPFLDLLAPDFQVDSETVLEAQRTHWCARTPLGYAILRHAEAVALLRDRRLHQGIAARLTRQGIVDGPLAEWWRVIVLNQEGETHTRLRRLVSKAFTPPAVERLRPVMRRTATELIDAFAPPGACEFVSAFADRYPNAIICELLEVPPEQREALQAWTNDLGLALGFQAAAHRERIETALLALYDCADALIAQRRNAPGADLISALIAAEESGDRLSHEELRAMIVGLLFAGNDTTRNQLGLAMVAFLQHPEQWATLAARPELAPQAVEEVMRLYAAAPAVTRIVAEDFVFQSLPLPAGTLVSVLLGAANIDPRAFDASEFDITRATFGAQLTFGSGLHHCLGNWLARAEMQEALPLLAARLREPRLAGEIRWSPPLGIRGPESLPIAFS